MLQLFKQLIQQSNMKLEVMELNYSLKQFKKGYQTCLNETL